jgi:hypothetical protein
MLVRRETSPCNFDMLNERSPVEYARTILLA